MAAITATVLAAAGTAMAVKSSMDQAKAAKATAKYNADVQRNQAATANQVATENVRRKVLENTRDLSRIRAAQATRGLASSGTPLAVLGESAMMLTREIEDINYQATTQYQALAQGANMTLWEGKQTAKAITTQGIATALGNAASVATGYADAKGLLSPKAPAPKSS